MTDLWALCAPVPKKQLRKPVDPLEVWGPEQEALARKLIGLCGRAPDASGLAAPQVGERVAMVVVSLPSLGLVCMVNPRIDTSVELTKDIDPRLRIRRPERCFSLGPDVEVTTDRAAAIEVTFDWARPRMRDMVIERIDRMLVTGQAACVVQHEVDHLNGKLITHREVKEG